jgi:hypothetical protein
VMEGWCCSNEMRHPLAFLSKALGVKSRGLSTYEKKYMAILLAMQHWRAYLQQAKLFIYTDHKSLAQVNEQRIASTQKSTERL